MWELSQIQIISIISPYFYITLYIYIYIQCGSPPVIRLLYKPNELLLFKRVMFTIVKLELLVHPNLLRFRGHGGPTLYTLHHPRHLPSSVAPLTQSARALKISPFPRRSRYPSGRNEGFSDAFVANHGISPIVLGAISQLNL